MQNGDENAALEIDCGNARITRGSRWNIHHTCPPRFVSDTKSEAWELRQLRSDRLCPEVSSSLTTTLSGTWRDPRTWRQDGAALPRGISREMIGRQARGRKSTNFPRRSYEKDLKLHSRLARIYCGQSDLSRFYTFRRFT